MWRGHDLGEISGGFGMGMMCGGDKGTPGRDTWRQQDLGGTQGGDRSWGKAWGEQSSRRDPWR